MRHALLFTALAGCSQPVDIVDGMGSPEVHSWASDVDAAGGTVTAQFQGPSGTELSIAPPQSTGLTFEPTGEPRIELVGEQTVLTQSWTFTGSKGNYIIQGPAGMWGEGEPVSALPLFIDVGVAAPREGELMDIVDPTEVRPFPVVTAVVVGSSALLILAGLVFAFRPRKALPPAPPVPPDVAALRAWDAAKRDASLDENARALAISSIFRTYTEAVLAFPATSWTTSEILGYLGGLEHLSQSNLPRAKELLRATDRVKFADADATDALFERLGADLEAFIESTRPRRAGGDG